MEHTLRDLIFKIYMWTNNITLKSYIGYTGDGIEFRWSKHLYRSQHGGDTYFDRSIRKYGAAVWSCKILSETASCEDAKKLEQQSILDFGTLAPNGYNSAIGGTGGNTWFGSRVDERKELLSKTISGSGNPRYSGISDVLILEHAIDLWEKCDNNWIQSKWYDLCREKGLPIHLVSWRFANYGGGGKGLKQAMLAELNKRGYKISEIKYTHTEEHRLKTSALLSGKIWVTDLITGKSRLDNESVLSETIIRGRKNVNN